MSIAQKLTELDGKVDEIYEAGKDKMRNDFWDALQNKGQRRIYASMFKNEYAGLDGFTDETLTPKYDIRPTAMEYMFRKNYGLVDLKAVFERQGIVFDTSECESFALAYGECVFLKSLPTHNLSAVPTASRMANIFNNCGSLENITFEGYIPFSISFAWSPLTIESIRSIINALKDYSGTSTSYTLTLKSSAAANMTEEDRQNITAKGWTLVET